MSFWKKLQNYVVDFEKSIDDDFAKRNQQVAIPNSKDLPLEQADVSDNENQKLISTEEEEEEKEENIISDEDRAIELTKQVKELEEELESQNRLFEKLQKIKEAADPNSASIIIEFETRFSRISEQINEMNNIEKKIQKEIEGYMADSEDIQTVHSDYSVAQKELSKITEEYSKIISDSKSLIDEDQQITIDIDKTNDLINMSKQKIIDIENEKKRIDKEKSNMATVLENEKEMNIKLSTENSNAENESQNVLRQQETYLENVNMCKSRISELKLKLKDADNENERVIEEQRKVKSESMKNLTKSIIEEMESERIELTTQLRQLAAQQMKQEEKNEAEMREMRNMISDAEIEGKTLNQRLSETKTSVPKLVEPIEMQIDSLKSVYNANFSVEKTVFDRLSKQLAEAEAKKGALEQSCIDLRQELDLCNQEKSKLNPTLLTNELQEINNSIEMLSKEIDQLRSSNFDLSAQVHAAQAEIKLGKSNLIKINTRIKNGESKYLTEIQDLRAQMELLQKKEMNASAPSLFSRWKQLMKECSDLETKMESKQEAINKQRELECVFSHTVELVAERQESIDQLKRTIQKDKDFFKQRVQELVDSK